MKLKHPHLMNIEGYEKRSPVRDLIGYILGATFIVALIAYALVALLI